ncbi:hypothetical protein PM8797T_12408 [Gimesia maris DSM 8797]|nr:hypothetical protein PM8797T_12408 [Gimesia maris DSM 8797]
MIWYQRYRVERDVRPCSHNLPFIPRTNCTRFCTSVKKSCVNQMSDRTQD